MKGDIFRLPIDLYGGILKTPIKEMEMIKKITFFATKSEKTDSWIAYCMNFHMVTQASKIEDLPKAIGHVLLGELLVCEELGIEPNYKPVPDYVLEQWTKAYESDDIVKTKSLTFDDIVPNWFHVALKKLVDLGKTQKEAGESIRKKSSDLILATI